MCAVLFTLKMCFTTRTFPVFDVRDKRRYYYCFCELKSAWGNFVVLQGTRGWFKPKNMTSILHISLWTSLLILTLYFWVSCLLDLFQKLFRQDLLVASLFRNFLLAERIMRSYNCTPMSCPRIPPTHQHPMWYVLARPFFHLVV